VRQNSRFWLSVAPKALKKGFSQELLLPNCRSFGAFTKEYKVILFIEFYFAQIL
jgi:hypothetical protein